MVSGTKSPQGLRLNPQNTLELSQGMSIQVAIDTADAHTGEWSILLYPGADYDEGDLTPSGGANITIRGMGTDRVTIAPVAAPAAGVIVSGGTLNLENLIVTAPDATMPALRVTGGALDADHCDFNGVGAGDAIQQIAGEITFHFCHALIGDVDFSAGICTFHSEMGTFGGTIDTAGAFDHVIRIHYCDLGGNALNLAATGACTYDFHNCINMGTITDASAAGTGHLHQCDVLGAELVVTGTSDWIIDNGGTVAVSNTNVGATVTIYAGIALAITRAVGSVVWWQDGNTLKVVPSGTITDTVIQHAVDAAAAGDTILITPGTYEEAVTLTAGRNLKGIDKELCLIDIDHATLVTMAEGCGISGLTLNVTSDATGPGYGVECNNVNCAMDDLEITLNRTAGIIAVGIGELTGGAATDIYVRNVRMRSTIDTNACGIDSDQANKTWHIENSWIQGGDRALRMAAASIVRSSHNHYETISGTMAFTITGATVYSLHDAIEASIYVGNLGTLRLKNSSYRVIDRDGTGNIVDESPSLKDAPWKVQKWDWMTSLAHMDVAVRGTPIDAGSGQILLEVTDDGADVEAVETREIAGALDNGFTPARTPRFLTQIFADAFDPHVTMFFGLRAALGNATPGAAEDHAGFDWNGTNFRATSSDGAGVGRVTNGPTPTVDQQVQLEVIVMPGVGVEFRQDGALVAFHEAPAEMPDAVLDCQHMLATLGAGGGELVQVGVRPGGCQECPL